MITTKINDRDYFTLRFPSVNLGTAVELSEVLHRLDSSLVGSPDYMGYTYFWSPQYREELRNSTALERVTIHDEMLKSGLPVDGESEKHLAIILKVMSA